MRAYINARTCTCRHMQAYTPHVFMVLCADKKIEDKTCMCQNMYVFTAHVCVCVYIRSLRTYMCSCVLPVQAYSHTYRPVCMRIYVCTQAFRDQKPKIKMEDEKATEFMDRQTLIGVCIVLLLDQTWAET